MKSIFSVFCTLALMLMLVITTNTYAAATVNEQIAPNFELKDAKGESFTLSDYVGKPVILHFWATWCPYCKKLQPGLDKLRLKYQDTDLQMIAISFNEDDDAKPAQSLLDRGIGIRTLILGDKVAKAYDVRGTPTTVFIERSGKIVWITNTSNPDDLDLDKAVKLLLE